jgi:probable DNA repair protein
MTSTDKSMDTALLDAVGQGAVILTVNDRLARHLLALHERAQQRAGRGVWQRPQILSLVAWLSSQRQRLPQPPSVLSSVQLQRSWEEVIAEDCRRRGELLLQVPQTARRALQAHQLLLRHAAAIDPAVAAADHQAFLRWRTSWQRLAAREGWHDPAELPWLLAEAVEIGDLVLPARLVLAGFDELTPDIERLSAAAGAAGAQLNHWQPQPFAQVDTLCLACADPVDEVRRCACWIKAQLEAAPEATVGVVVPQLDQYAALIERIFSAELAPAALLADDEAPRPFNLSLGGVLDREGVVAAALRLLRIAATISQDDASWLLLAPWLAGQQAHSDRALLDCKLRELRRQQWPLTRLAGTLRSLAAKHSLDPGNLSTIIKRLADGAGRARRLRPGQWAERFTGLLYDLGWPGEATLSSREYQAVESFRGLLGELASLDGVCPAMTRGEAVSLLARRAGEQEFQPEGSSAQIQVLGLLEAGGMSFDRLWVLGLHDAALPSPPGPNPFIPLPLQRAYRMMRCDAEREREFADLVTRRLFCAAPRVVLSWPAGEQGVERRPSPLLPRTESDQIALLPQASSADPARRCWQERLALERIEDDYGPSLPPNRNFSGGTGIIKDQALCPFRAFAHHRLRARGLDEADIGIDNMSRGTLMHTVLELFWKEVECHAGLISLDEQALEETLSRAVDAALERFEREQRSDLPARQRLIERQRLIRLSRQWLALERQREPFRVVASEQSAQATIGALQLRTRVDRIDELTDGRRAIIDYKTGRTDPRQWLEERITEPQLPIYTLAMPNDEIGAVLFAAVRERRKECRIHGVARDTEGWGGSGPAQMAKAVEAAGFADFDALLRHWRVSLSDLGDEFVRGYAAVAPIDLERACRYCDLTGLCRIQEQTAGVGGAFGEVSDG